MSLAVVKHVFLVFSAETKRLVSYRVQFWCEFILSSIVELLITVAVWKAVFAARGTDTIGDYTLNEMLVYVMLAVFLSLINRGTGTGTFARDIYDGSLTKYLVYPLSIYTYKLGTYLPRSFISLLGGIIALVGIFLLGLWPNSLSISLVDIALCGLAISMSTLLFFLLLFCIESIAFWADHVWSLSVILSYTSMLLSGKWIPFDLFPLWLQQILNWSPFPYLVYFPLNVLLGRESLIAMIQGFTVLTLWLVLIFSLSQFIYNRGLRSYTGVGI